MAYPIFADKDNAVFAEFASYAVFLSEAPRASGLVFETLKRYLIPARQHVLLFCQVTRCLADLDSKSEIGAKRPATT